MRKSQPLLCRGHSRPVVDLSFSSITPDGFFLVSGCLDGKPMLRYGPTGDWIGTFLGHTGAMWSARLNSTATQALTGSADYTAKLWDAMSGNELHTFVQGRVIKAVSFSQDDKKMVTGGQDKILRIYDLEKPTSPPSELPALNQPIKTIVWSSTSDSFFSAGGDNQLRVWDVRTRTQVKVCELGEPGELISSIELSSDKNLLTCCTASHVYFLNPSTLEITKDITLPKNLGLESVSLNPDNTMYVTGGSDFWVRVYDFKTATELELHKGHHGPVHCIKFSPDGEIFASGSEDGTIRLWQPVPKPYELWQLGGKDSSANGSNSNS